MVLEPDNRNGLTLFQICADVHNAAPPRRPQYQRSTSVIDSVRNKVERWLPTPEDKPEVTFQLNGNSAPKPHLQRSKSVRYSAKWFPTPAENIKPNIKLTPLKINLDRQSVGIHTPGIRTVQRNSVLSARNADRWFLGPAEPSIIQVDDRSPGESVGSHSPPLQRSSSVRGKAARWLPAPETLHFTIVGIQVSRIKKKKPASAKPTCKLLVQRSQKEDGVNGVTEKSFTKYLFPMYPELAKHFYRYIHRLGKCKNNHIPLATFRQHCEKILSMLDDALIIDTYVRMFSSETDENMMTQEGLRSLLYTSYKLSMDHYPEGPQTCLMIHKTLAAVVNGCFNKKDSHSVGFVVRWLEEHCHRLIFPVHRYCVHLLATRHRDMEAHVESNGSGAGLELGTPVLERSAWQAASALLPLSVAWLLAGTAPPLYSRPAAPPAPHQLASALWLARLVCAVPSHWAPLYASRDHGLGANRFLHHTLNYRGPTMVLISSEQLVAVVACPQEWRETHQYWGGPDSTLMQLAPTFSVIEKGPKMLYLNTSIRGYPKGLRAGSDPRKPLLAIDEGFDNFTFQGVPYPLIAVEVWGCGDQASRESQLEVKKWQVKEAERQSQVKLSSADWMEHPDRYLLEMAGRPQYNTTGS